MHHVPAMQSMLGAMGQKFADTVEQNMPPAGEASP
jgi:hypothetical protein